MLGVIKRFLETLLKMLWNILKKKFGDAVQKWALLVLLLLFLFFVGVVVLIWVLVAGF